MKYVIQLPGKVIELEAVIDSLAIEAMERILQPLAGEYPPSTVAVLFRRDRKNKDKIFFVRAADLVPIGELAKRNTS